MKKCLVCKTKFDPSLNTKWLPFCSERCRLIDLGDWLNESHRLSSDAEEPPSLQQDTYPKKH